MTEVEKAVSAPAVPTSHACPTRCAPRQRHATNPKAVGDDRPHRQSKKSYGQRFVLPPKKATRSNLQFAPTWVPCLMRYGGVIITSGSGWPVEWQCVHMCLSAAVRRVGVTDDFELRTFLTVLLDVRAPPCFSRAFFCQTTKSKMTNFLVRNSACVRNSVPTLGGSLGFLDIRFWSYWSSVHRRPCLLFKLYAWLYDNDSPRQTSRARRSHLAIAAYC